MKVETYLRMIEATYEVEEISNPAKAPKGKLPAIRHNGKVIADSTFIIKYLMRTLQPTLDDGIRPIEGAAAHAFSRMLEERFYWALVYFRWIEPSGWKVMRQHWFGNLPPGAKQVLPELVRRRVKNQLNAHGFGRHSEPEMIALARDDLASVSAVLADKPFFFGEQPRRVDAVVYAFMANVLEVPIESPLRDAARSHTNLVNYCRRMGERYFTAK